MYLIDSSVYIDLLRSRKDPIAQFAARFEQGEICTCGIVICEVLRGIVKRAIYERMKRFFELVEAIELDEELIRKACDLAWDLDREGTILPLSDIFIAAAALHRHATVVTNDTHFSLMPSLRWERPTHSV